jgi:AraC-like DNA-binding protein
VLRSETELAAAPTLEPIAPAEAAGGSPALAGVGEAAIRKVLEGKRFSVGRRLSDEVAIALVAGGLGHASRRAGVTERTLRRRLVRSGSSVSGFVAAVRLDAARMLFSRGWRTEEAAEALGYSGAAAFRRFLRRNAGVGVRSLRKGTSLPDTQ